MSRKNHAKHLPARSLESLARQLTCQQKRRFPTEKQARHAADTQELLQPGLELDVYQCPRCQGWHLTRTTEG